MRPHLLSSSEGVSTGTGASVELVCRVGGDPPPEVFWRRLSPPGELMPSDRLVQEERGQVRQFFFVSTKKLINFFLPKSRKQKKNENK